MSTLTDNYDQQTADFEQKSATLDAESAKTKAELAQLSGQPTTQAAPRPFVPLIDDLTANKFIDEAGKVTDPIEANRRADALEVWQQAKQFDYTRGLFKDIETLGGAWTPDMQARHAPFQMDPKQDRAAWANTRFFAHSAGISVEAAASAYDSLLAKYSYDHFKGEPKDSLSLYMAIKGKLDKSDADAKALSDMSEHAMSRGVMDAIGGSAPGWDAHLEAWKTLEGGKTPEGAQFTQSNSAMIDGDPEFTRIGLGYGKGYMQAYSFWRERPELGKAFRELVGLSGRTAEQPESSLDGVAKSIAEFKPEDRQQFFQGVAAWAKANGHNPQAFLTNIGEAMRRGADSAWGEGYRKGFGDVENERILKELKSGAEIRLRNGAVDLNHVVTQTDIDRANSGLGGDVFGVNDLLGSSAKLDDGAGRVATPEEKSKLEKDALKARDFYQAYRQVDDAAKNQINPIRNVTSWGGAAERSLYGLAEFAPVMGVSMAAGALNPIAGFAVMADGMKAGEYNRLMLQYPEMSAESADAVSSLSSAAMAFAGQLRILGVKGVSPMLERLPFFRAAIADLQKPTSAFWGPLIKRTALGTTEQWVDMNLMNTAPAAIQHVMSWLARDVPDVDWKAALGESIKNPETFFAALPFALVGAGVGTWKQSKAVSEALRNPVSLKAQGIPEEAAQKISALAQSGDMEGAQSAFSEAWKARTAEDKARGAAYMETVIQRARAEQESPATPTVRESGGKWFVDTPDGKASAPFDTAEEAHQWANDRERWVQNSNTSAIRELVDWFRGKDLNRKWVVSDEKKTGQDAIDAGEATPEQIAERMRIEGIQEGDPASVRVYGENVVTIKEGEYSDISKIHKGADPLTVVEERGHSQFEKELHEGWITMEQAVEAAKAWARESGFKLADMESPTPQEVREAAADMVKAHFMGEMRRGSEFWNALPSPVRSFMRRMAVYFRDVLSKAKKLAKMQKEGKLSGDWQDFLARAVGLDETVAHNRDMGKIVGEIHGVKPEELAGARSYSIGVYPGSEQGIPKDAKVWAKGPVEITKAEPLKFWDHGRVGEASKDALKVVRSIFEKHAADGGITTPDLGKVVASVNEMRHGLHLGETHPNLKAHMEAAGVLDTLLGRAALVVTHDPSKGAFERDPNLAKIHRLIAPLQVGDRLYRVKFTIKDFKGDSHHYYDHRLTEIEPIKTRKADPQADPSSRSPGSLPESGTTPLEKSSKTTISIAELLKDVKFGELSSYPMVNAAWSLGSKSYRETIAEMVDSLRRSPAERLDAMEKSKRFLGGLARERDTLEHWQDLSNASDERQAKHELDLENLRQERDGALADLQNQKEAEIARAAEANTVKFGDRIEAAKTPEKQKALERQAGEMASQIKKGIEKDFQHQAKALREKYATEERARKQAFDESEKQIWDGQNAADRREAQLASIRVLDGVLSAFPPEVRGKVGGFSKLAELTTDAARVKFFKERVEMLDREMERVLKEKYTDRFERLMEKAQPKKGDNRIQKSTLGPEAQENALRIQRLTEMDADTLAAEVEALEARIDAETDSKALADLSFQWALANQFGNLGEKSASELAVAVKEFDAMLKAGRSAWRMQEEARLEESKAKRGEVMAALGRPNGVTDSEVAAGDKRSRGALAKTKAFIESNLDFVQTMEEALGKAGRSVAGYFGDIARRSSNEFTDAMVTAKQSFRRDMMGLFGIDSVRELNRRLADLSKDKNTGIERVEGQKVTTERIPVETARRALDGTAALDFTREELAALKKALETNDAKPGNKQRDYLDLERVAYAGEATIQSMSELEAVNYLLSWGQQEVRARMERQGWTPEVMDKLRAWLSPDAVKVMGWLKDRYAEGYDKLNPVYRAMYGMNMPKIDNYAPTAYDVASANRGEQAGPADTTTSRSGMAAGFVKTRAKHDAPLARANALAMYWRHTVQAEYWTAWAETVREMRSVLGSSEVLRTVRAMDGSAREEAIKNWVKAFETNGQTEAGMLSIQREVMRRATGANAAIALAFKVGALMKQVSAMLGSSMELGPGVAAAGWSRFMTGQLSISLSEVWNSPTIQRRIEAGYSPEVRAVFQANGITPSRFAELVEKGMYPVGAVDAAFTTISAAIAFDAHYREAIKAGVPEAHARQIAMDAMDRTVHRTAQPAEAMDKSLNEVNASVFGKLLMLFKSEARQKFAISYLAAKRMTRGEEVGKNASRLVVTWALASAMTQLMQDLYQTVFTDKSAEEIWTWEDYARAMALGHLDGMYAAGPMMSAAATWAFHGKGFPSKSQNPLDQIASDLRRKQINPAKWEDGYDAFKGVTLYLQILARTGVSESVTGAAALSNAIKDALGLAKNLSGEKEKRRHR